MEYSENNQVHSQLWTIPPFKSVLTAHSELAEISLEEFGERARIEERIGKEGWSEFVGEEIRKEADLKVKIERDLENLFEGLRSGGGGKADVKGTDELQMGQDQLKTSGSGGNEKTKMSLLTQLLLEQSPFFER